MEEKLRCILCTYAQNGNKLVYDMALKLDRFCGADCFKVYKKEFVGIFAE